jgi:hypothetical protein
MRTWVFALGGGAIATALLLQRRRHARELAQAHLEATTSRDVAVVAAAMVATAKNRAQAESLIAEATSIHATVRNRALAATHGRRADGKPIDTLSL